MPAPDYIASDVHLGAVPRENERAFLGFLEHVGAHARSLLLAGDLFDFWFEYGTIIPGRHVRVLGALAALVEAGLPVTLAGGNHDAWGGRYLREEIGVRFEADAFEATLGGRRALVAHGDGVGRGDLKYRLLKATIRSRVAVAAFRALHPELGWKLAQAVSSTDVRAGTAGHSGRAAYIEAWARERLHADDGLSFVVCGHAHVPALVEVDAGRWYLNAGDWISHFTYITVGDGAPALRRWESQAARP